MSPPAPYETADPSRAEIDALGGPCLLEFGTPWCGFCRAAQPAIAIAIAAHPGVRHLRFEDGSNRQLGRSFGVKLWPTLVFLRDGEELARLVRPREPAPIAEALRKIDATA